MSAQAFIKAARGFLGAPWVHQGRTEKGMDCVGLVVLAARAVGMDAPLEATYGRMQDYRQARRYLGQFCERVGSAVPGDIVIFQNSQSLHMAIVSETQSDHPVRVIQAFGPKSKVVETSLQFSPMMLWRPNWPS